MKSELLVPLSFRGWIILWLAFLMLIKPNGTLLAQQEKASSQNLGDSREIEEVIVTARRVEESLQDTPVSVTAFGRSELEKIGFSDITDISRHTPNLDVRRSIAGADDVTLSMRGMSIGDPQIGFDPPIGVYLDGVYIARSVGMVFDIAEAERIEVLRGPQGTLFGRNTIGGAVNIVTREPGDEFSVEQQLKYGRRGRQRIRTRINTPVVSNLKASLTFLDTSYDGAVKSLHTGDDLGGRESTGGRLSILWSNDGPLKLRYNFDISRSESRANFSQITHTRPVFADPDGEFYGGAYFERLAELTSESRQPEVPIAGPSRLDTEKDIDGHSLTAEWHLNESSTVKSITGYREMVIKGVSEFVTVSAPEDGSLCASPNPGDYDFATGTCFNPVPAGELVSGIDAPLSVDHEQLSQEIQYIGSLLGDRLNVIAGLYYFEEKGQQDDGPIKVVIAAPFAAKVGFSDEFGVPQDAIVPQNRGNSLLINLPASLLKTDNTAYAAYGDFTYLVTPKLEATMGFRYSIDDRTSIKTDQFGEDFMTVTASNQWSNFNPSFTLNYQWNDQVRSYAKVVTSYRSGGFNQRVNTVEGFKRPFNEENVTSYEIGGKSELFGRTLRFNGALFYADYTDRQILTVVTSEEGVDTDIVNASSAVHSGMELEAIWQPFSSLRLTASYGYLNIDVKEFFDERLNKVTGIPVNPGEREDVADRVESPFAPENTGSIVADYHFDPFAWGRLSLRGDMTFTDEAQGGNPQLTLFEELNSHTLINARISLSDIPVSKKGALRVALWGKNLTNREYHQLASDFGVLGFVIHTFGEPRSYGASLVYEFNRQ